MKIYMVANPTDMIMQRTLYSVDAYKLISYGLFIANRAKTPKELMEWLRADIPSNMPGEPWLAYVNRRDQASADQLQADV